MRISRHYTTEGQSPYDALDFRTTTSEIRNPDGSIVFRLEEMEVPSRFTQVASDVLAQKYFRKAGVPAALKKVEENSVPSFLWRSVSDEAKLAKIKNTANAVLCCCKHPLKIPTYIRSTTNMFSNVISSLFMEIRNS